MDTLCPESRLDSIFFALDLHTFTIYLLAVNVCETHLSFLLPYRFDITFKRFRGAVTDRILYRRTAVRLAS